MIIALRHYLASEVIWLMAADGIVVFGWFAFYFNGLTGVSPLPAAGTAAGTTMLLMWSLGLYDRWSLFDRGHIASRLAAASLAALLLGGGLQYMVQPAGWRPAPLVEAAVALAILGSVALLHLVFPRVSTAARLKRRILVIGNPDDAVALTQASRTTAASVAVVGTLAAHESDHPSWPVSLVAEVARLAVDEIVVFGGDRPPLPDLLRCRVRGVAVTDHRSFWEREMGRMYLDDLDPAWLVYSNGFRASALDDAGKRMFDILICLLGLVLAAPVMLAAAALIAWDSPGPVIYSQRRVGQHGREFTLYKFRSMRSDAEKNGPQWAAKSDSRVTRIGVWLRKLRIDELPQFFNVLRGDMSFIGPRPERAFFVEKLAQTVPYYELRHLVRPGLTGWAQVSYKYTDSFEDTKIKFSYDLYYLKNRSFLLDMLIVLQTVQVILFPRDVH